MREVVWVEIPGHPDYLIDNYGNVRLLRTNKVIRPMMNRGYFRVCIDGKRYYIHKLMMMSFYPEIQSDRYIKHIDGDKTNNCLWNLRYTGPNSNL